jgi:hypothetical protein
MKQAKSPRTASGSTPAAPALAELRPGQSVELLQELLLPLRRNMSRFFFKPRIRYRNNDLLNK